MAEYRPVEMQTKFERLSHCKMDRVRLSAGDREADGDVIGHTAVQEAKPRLKRPSMYKVVMLNDDYTPMEFVVDVLETFFGMNREKATQVMLTVHTEGKAVCGIYSRDVAETKAAQVMNCAREHQHPLMCEIEPGGEGSD